MFVHFLKEFNLQLNICEVTRKEGEKGVRKSIKEGETLSKRRRNTSEGR